MNPSKKRGHVATARTAGRDASSTRPPKARIRVLIADDHGVVREGLVSMIQRNKADMTVVGEASNGREAVELWKELIYLPKAPVHCIPYHPACSKKALREQSKSPTQLLTARKGR